jgi:hypothetical protein
MKAQIRLKNDGTLSRRVVHNTDFFCAYEAGTNHCFAGCFFPDNHPAMVDGGNIEHTVERFPDLAPLLPMGVEGMRSFQRVHDCWLVIGDRTLRETADDWIDLYVEDAT